MLGELTALPQSPIAVFKGPSSKGREGKRKGERNGRGKGKGEGEGLQVPQCGILATPLLSIVEIVQIHTNNLRYCIQNDFYGGRQKCYKIA